jgi:hypothetical protein
MNFLKGALARARLPPVEQKVFDATNTDPWGPHGAVLGEIARATTAADERAQVMSVLWRRVGEEQPEQWRVVYKALTVMEYLVANGSEQAVSELRASVGRLAALSSFHYKDPEGKDQVPWRQRARALRAVLARRAARVGLDATASLRVAAELASAEPSAPARHSRAPVRLAGHQRAAQERHASAGALRCWRNGRKHARAQCLTRAAPPRAAAERPRQD